LHRQIGPVVAPPVGRDMPGSYLGICVIRNESDAEIGFFEHRQDIGWSLQVEE
jgi:hypothetical protein